MASTVTASARSFAKANSESLSITNAAQSGLGFGDVDFYVCGFFKFATLTGTSVGLINKYLAAGNQHSYTLYQSTDRKPRFYVSADGSTDVVATWGSADVSDGVWYFYEGWHNATANQIGVCLNRGTDVTTSHSGGVYVGTAPFEISGFDAGSYYDGLIQLIVITSGIPTTAERNAIYNSGAGVFYRNRPTLSLASYVSWYDCAETSGALRDAHGTNHLTDNNTVTSAGGLITYTAEGACDFVESEGDWLKITDASQTGLSSGDINDDFYTCGWAKLRAYTSGTASWMWMKANNNTDTGFEWQLRYNNNVNNFHFNLGIDTTEYAQVDFGFGHYEFDVWAFAEAWVDASAKTIYLSINRATPTTATWTGTAMRAGTVPFTVGAHGAEDNNGNDWDGQLANIVFCTGIPSDSNKNDLFGRGFGCHHSDRPTLSGATYVSWWPLTETTGTRYDVIGANHLTEVGTVTGADGIIYDSPAAPTGYTRLPLVGVG